MNLLSDQPGVSRYQSYGIVGRIDLRRLPTEIGCRVPWIPHNHQTLSGMGAMRAKAEKGASERPLYPHAPSESYANQEE